jgi:hypothetical protein
MRCNNPTKIIVLLALIMLLVGCGSRDGYQSVSGSVTFRGGPLEQGTIQFFCTGEQPIPCGGAMIEKGRYQVPKEHGLKPGTYLVRISSTERVENQGGDSMNPFLTRERIPSQYNAESKLTVEVRAGERGEFNFDLD